MIFHFPIGISLSRHRHGDRTGGDTSGRSACRWEECQYELEGMREKTKKEGKDRVEKEVTRISSGLLSTHQKANRISR